MPVYVGSSAAVPLSGRARTARMLVCLLVFVWSLVSVAAADYLSVSPYEDASARPSSLTVVSSASCYPLGCPRVSAQLSSRGSVHLIPRLRCHRALSMGTVGFGPETTNRGLGSGYPHLPTLSLPFCLCPSSARVGSLKSFACLPHCSMPTFSDQPVLEGEWC